MSLKEGMGVPDLDKVLGDASQEVKLEAREILKQVAGLIPVAQQVVAGALSPSTLHPVGVDEALASANELDAKLGDKVKAKKEAHDLAMKVLQVAGNIALKAALAGIA